ncbi:hypothetical protein FGG08_000166 [Glutinoglossum americanum]|uniref:Uncharacterized protein n=1 Tax=Glutinoglossum americanum TaxID=1670608 RepID=A0A9P8IIH1_9PEZI|nr:hypothetical protein FGG08_000166 [Glutinoglossum americanum]
MLCVRENLVVRELFLDKGSYPKLDRDNPESEVDRENSESVRGNILRPFDVPDFLNNNTCTDLNGYFGCKGTYAEGGGGELESYSTWFRCLVKMVLSVDESTQSVEQATGEVNKKTKPGKKYKWYEMGFFTLWDHSDHCRVLCIDTPGDLPSKLQKALAKSPFDPRDPFAMHAPLIDQVVKLYDDSVWAIRDPIREIEKTRQAAKPNFIEMYEISRHAVHISEVIAATIETMENILRQQKAVYGCLPAPGLGKTYRERAQEYTSFQLQMMKGLKLRSSSNYERLKSETTLVMNDIPPWFFLLPTHAPTIEAYGYVQAYNMLAQQDSYIIKSVTVLTMTFLPATFVSVHDTQLQIGLLFLLIQSQAFFSTTFFTFNDHSWQTSKQLSKSSHIRLRKKYLEQKTPHEAKRKRSGRIRAEIVECTL